MTRFLSGRNILQFVALLAALPPAAHAEWVRSETGVAWQRDGRHLWRFSFDPAKGKPFFHPVAAGGPSLTDFKPEDHPWHYGLWFSWKYINQVNYWEENRQSGQAEGATRWSVPAIETRPDGSARIRLEVTYRHPTGRMDLRESRELSISAPAADGTYTIDWRGRFTAGTEGALLDRTPMPDEPKGQVNGGYAGLSIRMANAPLAITFLSTEGELTAFSRDRARPAAPAVACNFADSDRNVGAIAILSDPANAGEKAPWYLIHSKQMRFACAAILAPRPRQIPPQGTFDLRYRLAIQPAAWTPPTLRRAWEAWQHEQQPSGSRR